jgi:hypothetical protein
MRYGPDDAFWVVTNPTHISTLGDILFETTLRGLERQFRGGLSMADNPTIFADRAEALVEARARMIALKTSAAILGSAPGQALAEARRFELKDAAGTVILAGDLP